MTVDEMIKEAKRRINEEGISFKGQKIRIVPDDECDEKTARIYEAILNAIIKSIEKE